MNVEIVRVQLGQKPILRNLLEFYEYDFSEYTQRDVNSSGTFEYKYLDYYWMEANRYPFFIKLKQKYIGFALIRKVIIKKESYYSVAEFFILKKYRRKKHGRNAAFKLFRLFKGKWCIHQFERNEPSQIFWRKVIAEFTSDNYEEQSQTETHYDGPCQIFEVR